MKSIVSDQMGDGWKRKKKENGKVEEKYCFQSNKKWVEEEE